MFFNDQNKKYLAAGAALLVMGAGLFYFVSEKDAVTASPQTDTQNQKLLANTITGLTDQDVVEILLITRSGEKHDISLSPQEGMKDVSFALPDHLNLAKERGYTLTYHIADQENQYTDFSLTVDQTKPTVTARLKDFPAESTGGITVDAFLAHAGVPVDWAGHLTLNSEINANDPVRICMTIDNPKSNMVICHDKPGVAS